MENNLIGISGKIGSGKDTVGKILQYLAMKKSNKENRQIFEEFCKWFNAYENCVSGYNIYQIKKFADKLKDIVCLLIGCTREQLEDREFKEKELSEEWRIHSFWAPMCQKPFLSVSREEVLDYMSLNGYQETSYSKIKSYLLTPRKLMQLLGTECGREILHPNIWVNALFADYKHVWNDPDPIEGNDYNITYRKDYPNTEESLIQYGGGSEAQVFTKEIEQSSWIITDVRFPNEAQAIIDRGGIVIRVNRPPMESFHGIIHNLKDGSQKYVSKLEHPSETALDGWDGFHTVIDNDGSIEELIEKVKQLKLV